MLSFWVLYNAVSEVSPATSLDRISEAAVKDEAETVLFHLRQSGHRCREYPLTDISNLVRDLRQPPDMIFNLCEGFNGKAGLEMHVAALLELVEVPFTGNSAKTLGIAQDKSITKRLLTSEGIPTPRWTLYTGEIPLQTQGLRFPLIVKPSREDASLGISRENVIEQREKLESVVQKLYLQYRQPILIEEFITGREFSVSLLESKGTLQILPISELSFQGLDSDSPPLVSYEAKWIEESPEYKGTPSICPAPLTEPAAKILSELARRTFRLLDGKDYGRVDFRMDPQWNPYVLEYNPNPDISPSAGFVRSLEAAKISYSEFLSILIQNNLPHLNAKETSL
jgi:D-alanine-D-alanine ligase